MLTVKILGAGCSNCERLYEVTRRAADSLGAQVEVIKITDFPEMMKYGILQTPGLVVNEELIMVGKVPSLADMTTILTKALGKSVE